MLEKENFKNLKELNLGHNCITDILDRVNFPELKELNLCFNKI